MLWLHIGLIKTGTTTLQGALAQNRALLSQTGLFYPQSPGGNNHIDLALYASNGPGVRNLVRTSQTANVRKLKGNSPTTADGQARFRDILARRLAEEVATCGAQQVILSNEHLSARLHQPQEIQRLHDLLQPMFSSIRVVIYLRHQPDLYLSAISTMVKGGGEPRPPPTTPEESKRYNFELLLDRWAAVFGQDAMHVRLFGKGLLQDDDILSDFFHVLGRAVPAGLVRPEWKNPRLDRAAMRFLELFHQHVPKQTSFQNNADHGDIVQLLEMLPADQPFCLRPAQMQRIADAFEDSNARVARKYFGREGPLFPAAAYPAAPAGPPLTAERAVAIAAFLWRQKQAQLRRLRAGGGDAVGAAAKGDEAVRKTGARLPAARAAPRRATAKS